MPRVEFYGIPRERAGVAEAQTGGATLGDVLAELAARFPRFAEDCLDGVDRSFALKPQVAANLGGDLFVRDPQTVVADDEVVLILSADAGG